MTKIDKRCNFSKEEAKYSCIIGTISMEPTYDEILRAKSMNTDKIRKTSLVYSPTFSMLSESKVFLKSEFQQKTGAFKIRGAYFKIQNLSEEDKRKGVIAASAGNHAQGVAYAAKAENIQCTIVMPKNASPADRKSVV